MPEQYRFSYDAELDRYLSKLLPTRDKVLAEMENYSVEHGFPYIGPLVGPLLAILAKSVGASRIFEMGSGFGYSAIYFARVLPEGGKVVCTDGDPENEKRSREFFRVAGVENKIEFRVGNAIELINQDPGLYDVILMDIDKEDYPEGFRVAWPKLRVGGLFIADNLLWHGKVMTDDYHPSTKGVRLLSSLLYETPGAMTSILPLRDGVSVSLKTK